MIEQLIGSSLLLFSAAVVSNLYSDHLRTAQIRESYPARFAHYPFDVMCLLAAIAQLVGTWLLVSEISPNLFPSAGLVFATTHPEAYGRIDFFSAFWAEIGARCAPIVTTMLCWNLAVLLVTQLIATHATVMPTNQGQTNDVKS